MKLSTIRPHLRLRLRRLAREAKTGKRATQWSDEVEGKLALDRLTQMLADFSDVYIGAGVDKEFYLGQLAEDIQRHVREPFFVVAVVMSPGFPELPVGEKIGGLCVAQRNGYWLVYRPENDRFYCFWGDNPDSLGAHGISGSPLYCWSA